MIHASMGSGCRGQKAAVSALRAFEWVFENTGSEAVFAAIPADLRHVCFLARHIGMEYIRTDEDGDRHYRMLRADMMLNKRRAA